MKKIILSVAVVALVMVSVSCSKSYTCTCGAYTGTYKMQNYQVTQNNDTTVYSATTIKKGETDAATACQAMTVTTKTTSSGTYVSGNYTTTTSYTNCSLEDIIH